MKQTDEVQISSANSTACEQELALQDFNEALSKAIRAAIREAGIPVGEFAKRIHFTRTTLSSMFGSGSRTKLWRLPVLLTVAEALHLPLSTLIKAAEIQRDGGDPAIELKLAGTEERSAARMQRLIYLAAFGRIPGNSDEDMLLKRSTSFQYLIQNENPWLFDLYRSGKLSDQEIFALLSRALEYDPQKCGPGEEPLPFSYALRALQKEYADA